MGLSQANFLYEKKKKLIMEKGQHTAKVESFEMFEILILAIVAQVLFQPLNNNVFNNYFVLDARNAFFICCPFGSSDRARRRSGLRSHRAGKSRDGREVRRAWGTAPYATVRVLVAAAQRNGVGGTELANLGKVETARPPAHPPSR